jgi:glycine cleavage system H protein
MSLTNQDRFLPTHEWARADGDLIIVGVTHFASQEMGEVVHIAPPAPGTRVGRGAPCAEVESVKAVNDIHAPVDGIVEAINPLLNDRPNLVNEDPTGQGWLFSVRVAGPQALHGLLTLDQYQQQITGGSSPNSCCGGGCQK